VERIARGQGEGEKWGQGAGARRLSKHWGARMWASSDRVNAEWRLGRPGPETSTAACCRAQHMPQSMHIAAQHAQRTCMRSASV
jgi:hypothetical protein